MQVQANTGLHIKMIRLHVCMLSCVWLFATPWIIIHQAPLSMGLSRQEYWNGLPFPPPRDLPDPGIERESPAVADEFFTTGPPGKPQQAPSVQFSSVTQSCSALCNPRDCSTPGFPVHYQLLELTQTHIHWVGDAIQPSHLLSSPSPPAFYVSHHQGLFPRSQFYAAGGQSIGVSASASVLPMNIQDWFPLGWTGLISLLSKGLSRVFSNTTVQSISSSALSFLYSPTLTSIHDYWKNHSFD